MAAPSRYTTRHCRSLHFGASMLSPIISTARWDTMVVVVGQMGILSAHAWCGTSVKNTMEETIMKRIIYVNHAIL